MIHIKDSIDFDKQMELMKETLETKGYVVESDHPYAYSTQYPTATKEMIEWLKINGYKGNLNTQGYFDKRAGAVYGLYDADKVSYDEMHRELKKEATRQATMC